MTYATFWIYSPTLGVFGRLCAAEDVLVDLEADARLIPDKPDGEVRFDPKQNEWVADPSPELTPEERRALMPPLAKWRVDTIIDLEPGLRDRINAAIDAMGEPQRTISRNKLASVTEFSRTDPLFELIGADPSIGKTPEDIDAMWEAAQALI